MLVNLTFEIISCSLSCLLHGFVFQDLARGSKPNSIYSFLMVYVLASIFYSLFRMGIHILDYLLFYSTLSRFSTIAFVLSDEIKCCLLVALGLDLLLQERMSSRNRHILFLSVSLLPGILWFILYEIFVNHIFLINAIDILINYSIILVLFTTVYGKLRSQSFVEDPRISKYILLLTLNKFIYYIFAIYIMAIFKEPLGSYLKLLLSICNPILYFLIIKYQSPSFNKLVFPWLLSDGDRRTMKDLTNLADSIYEETPPVQCPQDQ